MTKQEKIGQKVFTLTITRDDDPKSTDKRFTMDDLGAGKNYEPVEAFLQKADGKKIWRKVGKDQIWRKVGKDQIWRKVGKDKKTILTIPTMPRIACQVFEEQIDGLSVEDRESFPVCQLNGPSSTMYYGIYTSKDEFLQHYRHNYFGYENKFFLYYDSVNLFSNIIFVQECLKRFGEPGDKMVLKYREKDEQEKQEATMQNFKSMLEESKNLIFRGAPGTGKSYLAKEIAAYMVSDGKCKKLDQLDEEQRKQVEFVQFHPSYDYTDFVEGLRPKVNDDGTMVFELQDGIFKKFIARARKNYEDSQKSKEEPKKYVFIIDEINRGEISKIFGELFFSIDPEYRGPAGEVSTQYSNLHDNPDEKFYIPENVYIIGTMNDIDRSVDSFDFAMRRRFRFVELKADDHIDMLSELKDKERDAIDRMSALNKVIADTEGLNENYQIGASYFLKLETLTPDQLWDDYLYPLLQEYIRGMYDEKGIMNRFEKAYKKQANGGTDKKQANGGTDDAA